MKTQHRLAHVQALINDIISDETIVMSDNERCELGLALQVVERLQLDPYQVIADHFGTTRDNIERYIDYIDQYNIAFVIPSDEVSTIESILDIIRGYRWSDDNDKILCSTLACLDIGNISIDITDDCDFYITIGTKGYMRAIS
tara:strand:+ start:1379 stop:1807 length:429 start_codon:yes stop_codon:yes gene_type:complete